MGYNKKGLSVTSRKVVGSSFAKILEKLGNPPIRLVSNKEFKEITGVGVGYYDGRSSPQDRIVVVKYNRPLDEIKTTLWHEVAHVIFPKKRHWWIECFAVKMHDNGQKYAGRYSFRYGYNPGDIPSRAKCLKLAQKAASKLTP